MPRSVPFSSPDALDRVHALDAADLLHHRVQRLHVRHPQIEALRGRAVRVGGDAGGADVHARRRDGLGDLREQAGLVARAHPDAHLAGHVRALVPFHLDLALRIHAEGHATVARMHGDAAAARDEAHDLVAGQRYAAAPEAHHHVAVAVHADAARGRALLALE